MNQWSHIVPPLGGSRAPNRLKPELQTKRGSRSQWVLSLFFAAAQFTSAMCGEVASLSLPDGVSAVWDLAKAYHESTPSRERVCLNGLWQWQPETAVEEAVAPPSDRWGYFKVPGPWPGTTDYMQKDCQTVHAHPAWRDMRLSGVTAAWYQREVTVPAEWAGRRIALQVECLNSVATVFVNGTRAGDLRFPGGELDVSSLCRPGHRHVLSLFLRALPLKAVMLSHTDTAAAREVRGSVARRGLCGDVYLAGTPPQARLTDAKVETSVRKWEIVFEAGLAGLAEEGQYTLHAQVEKNNVGVARFTSKPFGAGLLKNGRFAFAASWRPEQLWDLDTPANTFDLRLSLRDGAGRVLDTWWVERFGFREFWIDGRDFVLNGTRIFLSCIPFDNAQVGAAWATYNGALESFERLKAIGINFVYTHNYGCEPGSHLSFAGILRAADDAGVLVALSQPHFSHYDWKSPGADQTNSYARHAAFYVRVAQNHPSVVFYSMSHNATGYNEDMNPDRIDGKGEPRDQWALNNSRLALRAEAIVKQLDPSRIVYHHASGNLGSMHPINFYPNFVPIQEMSDWFEHWATEGVKPVFLCEYGAPFTWDWTMYRGWYKDQREFGSARVPWEFCVAEWNAQFLGDRAFQISAAEKANLRWEAKQFRAGSLWHRWDYPVDVGSTRLEERYPVFAMYLTDNWRAFRTWGVSATSPWEHGHYWKLRDGVDTGRRELEVDWQNLQKPGFSPDYLHQRYERMDLAFDRSDWIPTPAAEALVRNNRPLLAWIGGKPAAFTSKDHNFSPGESFEKQIILINASRRPVTARCDWSLAMPQAVSGSREVPVAAGDQARLPVGFKLPSGLAPGTYELKASVEFSTGENQSDSFTIHVVPPPTIPKVNARIAVFDPKGETSEWLNALGIPCQHVDADAGLSAADLLIVGKGALTIDGAAPGIMKVREGLKVLIFEQTSQVLERRFGFRVAEYGLRWLFPRTPDHPALAGIDGPQWYNWRGAATLLPPRLDYELRPRHGTTVKWCDIPVTRLWRCGNRGNVASVLIEKPAIGDFMPILDGGYNLQYSPLLEYREGKGLVVFCQADVTGRTESDPVAQRLAANLLEYVARWKPSARREAVYCGGPDGKRHLEAAGVAVISCQGAALSSNQVLVVAPGGGQELAPKAAELADWFKAGGSLLAVGLDEAEANSLLPFRVSMKKGEHISAFFEPWSVESCLAGVGPADVHNRDPRDMPLVSGGAKVRVVGNGVLACAEGKGMNVVFCQLAPWQFDGPKPTQANLRRTHRRVSFLLSRLLANLGVSGSTPILTRFSTPVAAARAEKRWLDGLYLDTPEEWDEPYRFFRW